MIASERGARISLKKAKLAKQLTWYRKGPNGQQTPNDLKHKQTKVHITLTGTVQMSISCKRLAKTRKQANKQPKTMTASERGARISLKRRD